MGIISGLVASPCTTAPLTAILLVIAQTGDLVLGFSALYALSIGMGIPLIIFGITGGKLLPKAGQWMNVVKATFGFMMLSVAILFVERFIIADWTELLWATLGLALFTYWFTINQDTKLSLFKGVRTAVVMIGMVGSVIYGYTVVNKMQGHTNQLVVTSTQGSQALSEKGHPKFAVVKDIDDFYAKLAQASGEGKSVMLDLYADWCIACKEFEKYTFPDPNVIKALENTVWMQIDLTDNTPQNLAFQEYFKVLGLPTILFFDENGYELSQSRVTGFMKAEPFAKHVENSLNQP
jgi:thiol:disulfide interchange protein DsbD